jgi:predicted RNA methylase
LAGFCEAITKIRGIVYDIGAGSGILTEFAASYANFIYSVEIDPQISRKTRDILKNYKNISFINDDARKVDFPKKADYIICEMLDTALIDEEQVPILNSVLKYLKNEGKVIPCGIFNGAEPIQSKAEHIYYQEDETSPEKVLGPLNIYSKYEFGKYIHPLAEFKLKIKINREGILNSLKITTFTLITEDIICGPTPMMNSPLVIPMEKLKVKPGDTVGIYLSYQMGGGLDTIETRIKGISRSTV